MPTANDLIEAAALKLGAKQSGEALTADEANDSLSILNSMLEYWSIKKLLVYQIQQETFTWTGNATSQTIGSGGDFATTRPIRIEEGTFFRDSNNIDVPVDILRSRAAYDSLPSKSDTTTFPGKLFYDPAYPLGVLYVYPVPSTSMTLKLNSTQQIQNFSGLTTDMSLPPGFQWAIENNLAVALEPVFQVPAPASVIREADNSLSALKRMNSRPIFAAIEAAYVLNARGRSDIEAGTP